MEFTDESRKGVRTIELGPVTGANAFGFASHELRGRPSHAWEESLKPVYLDYNATTPIDVAVRQAMIESIDLDFGNPSSTHHYGVIAKRALESARAAVASCIGAEPEEILFTSGGTESDNMAIRGVAHHFEQRNGSPGHIISSAIEHPAVDEVLSHLKSRGWRISRVSVNGFGQIDPDAVSAACNPDTALVSIMHSNNEIGTLLSIRKIVERVKAYSPSIIVHTDAAQSLGKVSVSVNSLGVDLLTIAGHKMYAAKGIGALFVRTGIQLAPILFGAGQERSWRPGTENVILAVGLGTACGLVQRNLYSYRKHQREMRDFLCDSLFAGLPENTLRINGAFALERSDPTFSDNADPLALPNVLNVSFRGLEANTILDALKKDVAASAGAACHAGDVDLSPVLSELDLPMEWAMGAIRFSVGRMTSKDEIERAAAAIIRVVSPMLSSDASNAAVSSSTVALTQYTHGLGCACKLRPQALEEVMRSLPVPRHPDLLVGSDTFDDACVFRVSKDVVCVSTVDFFTPVVDDPFSFGEVAAANAMSDCFAMNVRPSVALNICGFPSNRLPLSVLTSILAGAQKKASEAGCVIAGGHTIEDNEPKFGMAVMGFSDPQSILRNTGAKEGDALLLTKPLGTGILTTALKRGFADAETEASVVSSMALLNDVILSISSRFKISACTDVTGFGLLGHLHEMLADSDIGVDINASLVPLLPRAFELCAAGVIPGGTKNNFVSPFVDFKDSVPPTLRILLCDAQTSGGLLITLPQEDVSRCLAYLTESGTTDTVCIGNIVHRPHEPRIHVV